MGGEDPFEFFRQRLPESQNRQISLEEERRDKRARTEYPIFTFAPLIIGILGAVYTFFIWLGIYSGLQGTIYSIGKLLERYSGLALSVNGLSLFIGLFTTFITNKKKFTIAAVAVCFLVSIPLAGMYLTYLRPPAVKLNEAITIAYYNVPASVIERAPLAVRWNRQSGPDGTWEMEFDNANITPEELGWTSDPSGSPSVILNLIGDSGLPENMFKTLLIRIDGKTGEVTSKMATAAQYSTNKDSPPQTLIPPKSR